MTVLGVLAFVLALTLSVALHEAGHLLTAKRFGMKASQYFIGFGPRIWSFRRGETEYGVKAIPAGGYVKIVGMTPLEQLDPADEPRAFWRQPAGRRTVVLGAGSFMHAVIALVLTFAGLALAGDLVHQYPGTRVAQVSRCLPAVPTAGCAPGDPASPAARAGIRPGDQLVSLDGRPIASWAAFTRAVRAHPGVPVRLVVRRSGRLTPLVATPAAEHLPGSGSPVGFLGVEPTLVTPHYGPLGLARHTGDLLGSYLTGTVSALGRLPAQIPHLLENRPRSGNGIAGVVDVGRLSGQIASATGTPLAVRAGSFLLLIAELNFSIGLINLLPLLPLDGGHIAIIGFEGARSRLARALHRPDPGRVDLMKVIPVAYTVIALFAGLSLLLVYAGFANPIRLQ